MRAATITLDPVFTPDAQTVSSGSRAPMSCFGPRRCGGCRFCLLILADCAARIRACASGGTVRRTASETGLRGRLSRRRLVAGAWIAPRIRAPVSRLSQRPSRAASAGRSFSAAYAGRGSDRGDRRRKADFAAVRRRGPTEKRWRTVPFRRRCCSVSRARCRRCSRPGSRRRWSYSTTPARHRQW